MLLYVEWELPEVSTSLGEIVKERIKNFLMIVGSSTERHDRRDLRIAVRLLP